MMSREMAYECYLSDYEIKIDNMILEANRNQKTCIVIREMPPKEITNKLKETKYNLEPVIYKDKKEHSYRPTWDIL